MTNFFIVDSGFQKSFYSLYTKHITPIGDIYSHYHGNAVLQALIFTLQQNHIFHDSHIYISSIYNSSFEQALSSVLPYISSTSINILSLSLSSSQEVSNSLTSSFNHIFSAYDASNPFLNDLSNAFSCSNRHPNADFRLPIDYSLFGISGNSLITPIIAVLYTMNPSLSHNIFVPPYLHPDFVKSSFLIQDKLKQPLSYPKCPKCYTNVKPSDIFCPHCHHRLRF